MVEYFKPNQVLILPELAGRLQLKTDKFFVRQKFDGGMGTCYRIEDEQNRSYALKIIHQNKHFSHVFLKNPVKRILFMKSLSNCLRIT